MTKLTYLRRAAAASLAALALICAAPTASASWLLTTRDGFLTILDRSTGQPVHRSTIRADGLSDRDRLLLECGLVLDTPAALTGALEDYFS